jgi:hypothetical protein
LQEQKLFIHAGLIKTGSSFLQSSLFEELTSQFNYVNSVGVLTSREVFQSSKPLIISNENLSGNPLMTKEYGKTYNEQLTTAILNLEKVFNNPNYIIGFREPGGFVKSLYKQHLHEWGTLSWNQFHTSHEKMIYEQLFFSKSIGNLKEIIPNERLFLYDHEDLNLNQELLIQSLLNFLNASIDSELKNRLDRSLGKRQNQGISDGYITSLLHLNRLSMKMHNTLGIRLAFKIGKFGVNPNIFCREILPQNTSKSKEFKGLNDINAIRIHYLDDWQKASSLMKLTKQ